LSAAGFQPQGLPQVPGLGSPGTTDDVRSETLDVGGPVGVYTTVLFPLERFRKGQFDLKKVATIALGVTGAESGEGAVSVRSVRFVSWK
jgi:hypothetical protein